MVVCAECGADISHRGAWAKYCGPGCAQRFRRAAAKASRPRRDCGQCGVDITARRLDVKFCSTECGVAFHNGRLTRAQWVASDPRCVGCGESTSHRQVGTKYCSVECNRRTYGRAWYATEHGRRWVKDYSAARYREKRAELIAYQREHRLRSREMRRATMSRWFAANPHARRVYSVRRRARIRAVSVFELSQADAVRILSANGGTCFYCSDRASEHLDHVVPISRGGSHSYGNLVGACAPCNLSKHNKFVIEWRRDSMGR